MPESDEPSRLSGEVEPVPGVGACQPFASTRRYRRADALQVVGPGWAGVAGQTTLREVGQPGEGLREKRTAQDCGEREPCRPVMLADIDFLN